MGDMDSGNSGSIQSSSSGGGGCGGDDHEFDSVSQRGTESISAFLNCYNTINMDSNITTAQLYSFSNGSSPFPHNNLQVSNYFPSLECPNLNINNTNNHINNHHHNHNHNHNSSSNNNSNNQVDMVWPNKFPSTRPSISSNDTNCTTEGPLAYTITNNYQQQSPTTLPLPAHGPLAPSSGRAGPGKNPKKRSRASRRAPTTVLTTDTTNFRQMVQEFTGIPAPPFTAFSARTRFDLFSGLGGHSSNNSSSVVVQPPSFLLRPFPQKIAPLHQPQFLGNTISSNDNNTSSVINNTTSITPIMNDTLGLAAVSNNTAASTSPTTFQLCDPQDYLSSTNQHLNLQSFLQSSASASASASALNDKYSLPALVQQDSSMNSTQISCSVNPAGENGSYLGISTTTNTISVPTNGSLDNIGGVTKGSEGMVDSWICSSD